MDTMKLFGIEDYTKHPLFGIWKGLWDKCYNPSSKSYHIYGAKGVTMSPEWRASFLTFAEDMGPKPTWSYVLTLVDEKEGFKKGNCVWASRTVMGIRKSRSETRYLEGVKGVHYCKTTNMWVAQISLKGKITRLGRFYNFEDAVAARKAAEEEMFTPILEGLKPKPVPLSDVELLA